MTHAPQTRLSVDEFLAQYAERPGQRELYDGVVFGMFPRGAEHGSTKLAAVIRRAGLLRLA